MPHTTAEEQMPRFKLEQWRWTPSQESRLEQRHVINYYSTAFWVRVSKRDRNIQLKGLFHYQFLSAVLNRTKCQRIRGTTGENINWSFLRICVYWTTGSAKTQEHRNNY